MGYQLADSVTGAAYSFVGTCMILGCLDLIGKVLPVFKLRASEEEEVLGIDDVEIGEFAVGLSCIKFGSFANRCSMTTWSSRETSKFPRRSTMDCRLTRSSSMLPLWELTRRLIL